MATLILDNLPDELLEQIEKLAQQHHQSINEQVIDILIKALQEPQKPLKFIISPEIDPTWEERRKAVPQLQYQIDQRRRLDPQDYNLPDSTDLIREDRDR